MFLILEYAANGNLFRYIRSKPGTFSDPAKILELYRKICEAVAFIHHNSMVHRDIKPENILIDEHLQPKLCDFGWTINLEKNESRQTFCGTYEYMAPEIFEAQSYNASVDIWSLGILLFELFHGHSPYSGSSVFQIYKNIVNQKLVCKDGLNPAISSLIFRILQIKPDKRPSIDEILADKCLTEPLSEPAHSVKSKFGKPSLFLNKFKPKTDNHALSDQAAEPKPTLPLPSKAEKDDVNEESLTAKRPPTSLLKNPKNVVKFQFSRTPQEKSVPKPPDHFEDNTPPGAHQESNGTSEPQTPSHLENMNGKHEGPGKSTDQKKIFGKGLSGLASKFPQSKFSDTKKLILDKGLSDTNSAVHPPSIATSLVCEGDRKIPRNKNLDLIKMMGKPKDAVSVGEPPAATSVMTPSSKMKATKFTSNMNQFSKNISLYIGAGKQGLGQGHGLYKNPDGTKPETGLNGGSNNVTENSLSQNEISKNSMSNFSMQHSKKNLNTYFSNRSNIVDKKGTVSSGAISNSTSKGLLESIRSKKAGALGAAEDHEKKDHQLFKNMISCNVRTGLSKRGNEPSEEFDEQEGSNLYSALGQKNIKMENSKLQTEPAESKPKFDFLGRSKVEGVKKTIDFKTKIGTNLPPKKSLGAESRTLLGLKPAPKPATGEAELKTSKRLASILKK